MRSALRILAALFCAAALVSATPARAGDKKEVAEVITAYYQSAALENLETYLALQHFAPGERERTARFAKALWAKVGSRDIKLGPVKVILSPDGDRAVASYTVAGSIFNKATGESFRKKTRCVAILVKQDGWKVDRVLPEIIFKNQLRGAGLRYYARRLLAQAERPPAPPPGPTLRPPVPPAPAGATSAASAKALAKRGYVVEVKANEVVIDLGKEQGIKTGDRFQVVRSKVVKHPVTGKHLAWRQAVAIIQVKETQDQLSIATTVSGGKGRPAPGDRLRPLKKP